MLIVTKYVCLSLSYIKRSPETVEKPASLEKNPVYKLGKGIVETFRSLVSSKIGKDITGEKIIRFGTELR